MAPDERTKRKSRQRGVGHEQMSRKVCVKMSRECALGSPAIRPPDHCTGTGCLFLAVFAIANANAA